ncbi:MAG TPA: DUF503 domain-containing protein [Thermoanaerobaculia bacterium]|nr:DUF503 domain-containing protein [Thermoanaerobaculia bacterium]
MFVGYGALALHLPHARDLKSKRRVVRGLIDRIHSRHRVSIAETAHHDLHQRAEIGIAVVAADGAEVERILSAVLETADREVEAVVLEWNPTIFAEKE